jgi:Protein of unknown function (DUF2892)
MSFLSFMNAPLGRAIRVGGGLLVLVVGLLVGGPLGAALALFSLLPIATGVFGLCPVNPVFGRSVRACTVPTGRRPRNA